MRFAILHTSLLVCLGIILPGCGLFSRRADYPDDPLLISKKPVEGKVEGTVPVMVAYAEPQPPSLPNTALDFSPPRLVRAIPVSRQKLMASTGHAPDYSWFQGVVGSSESGGLELRYADSPEADALGGKIRLEDDPRLAQVKIGDVIRVEGAMVKRLNEATRQADATQPVYRIREMWLVGRRN